MAVIFLALGAWLAASAAALQGNSAATVQFAVIGDMGETDEAHDVANLVRRNNPDLILTVGDNCYGRTDISDQVGNKYAKFVRAGRFWPTLGNHEFTDRCGRRGQAYFDYFDLPNNERYYDFVAGPAHFFAINSHAGREPDGARPRSRQGRWVQQRANASMARWKIAFFHHPPFSSGDHGSTARMQWPFEDLGFDLVLSGHDHNYERILRDDNNDARPLTYIVSGLGGQEPRRFVDSVAGSVVQYNDNNGALFVTATASALKIEFRDVSGSLVDSATIRK